MPNIFEGLPQAVAGKWAIVVSRYNDHLTSRLLEGAVSTLIDVKVLPKTMVHGYGDWWRVGVAQVSKSEKVHKVYEEVMVPHLDAARKYLCDVLDNSPDRQSGQSVGRFRRKSGTPQAAPALRGLSVLFGRRQGTAVEGKR